MQLTLKVSFVDVCMSASAPCYVWPTVIILAPVPRQHKFRRPFRVLHPGHLHIAMHRWQLPFLSQLHSSSCIALLFNGTPPHLHEHPVDLLTPVLSVVSLCLLCRAGMFQRLDVFQHKPCRAGH